MHWRQNVLSQFESDENIVKGFANEEGSRIQVHLIHRKPLRLEFQQSVYRPLRLRYYLYFKALNNEHLSTCNSIVSPRLTNDQPDVSFHTYISHTACSDSPFTRVEKRFCSSDIDICSRTEEGT